MIEAIEARRFLTVTAALEAGTLTVTSDDASDRVGIGSTPQGAIVVRANAETEPVGTFHANEVMRIAVNLGAGDDALTTHHLNRPMLVHGGLGNDRIQGGMRPDRLFGDDGNDRFNSAGGGADWVNGGAGEDGALIDHHDHVAFVEHIHFPTVSMPFNESGNVIQQIGLADSTF